MLFSPLILRRLSFLKTMSVIFINDFTENLKNDSYVFLYADDTNIFREITCPKDSERLQEDIYSMCE